ncbi:MAG: carbon-nitrogen hydrolase family protein [Myxococcota bacterium]
MEDAPPEARRIQAGAADLSEETPTLKLALLQLVACGRDRAANLAKGERHCREAAARGAELALFPELWSAGYQPFDDSDALEPDSAFVRHLSALARELGLAIALTFLERTARGPRNALALFDRHGVEVLRYAKVHLCPWGPPDSDCVPGDAFPVCPLDTRAGPVQVGAMICFDREFPEAAKLLSLNGAELIVTPNSCKLNERGTVLADLRLAQFRARAFENLVAVAMANYAAPQHDGHSAAYYPDGGTIVVGDEREGIVMAELDLARLRAFRSQEAGRDAARRPELYGPIASRVRL